MSPTGDIFTTQFQGRRTGEQFVDFPPSGDLYNSTISEINVDYNSNVYHLRVLVCLVLYVNAVWYLQIF